MAKTINSTENLIIPNFINVGPGRSGTSWLFEMLEQHHQISLSKVKETEYFNTNFEKGMQWYLNHFESSNKAVGEISNMYYLDKGVAARIYEFNPEMKIIFNIREPSSLLKSIAGFGVRRGIDSTDPGFYDTHMGLVMGSGYRGRKSKNILNSSDTVLLSEAAILSDFIKPFTDVFPSENIYFLVFERIANEPEKLLREIFSFLEVDASFKVDGSKKIINSAISPRAKWVSSLATTVSFLLRKFKAYGLLKTLHKSNLIKNIFYSPSTTKKNRSVISFPVDLNKSLIDEKLRLLKIMPRLKNYW